MFVPIKLRIQESLQTDLVRDISDGAQVLVKVGQEVSLADKIAEFYETDSVSALKQKRTIRAGCWGKLKKLKKRKF